MQTRVIGNDGVELFRADDVTQERVRDEKRKGEEDSLFEKLFSDLADAQRRGGQGALSDRIAFDEVFYFTKNHFHQQGLRASPTAPEPAKCGGENDNAGQKNQHGDGKNSDVLRPENLSEDGEPALDDVHEQERIAIDPDERANEENGEQQPAQPGAPAIEAALGLFRVNPLAMAFFVGGRQMVAEILPVNVLGDGTLFGRWKFWLHVIQAMSDGLGVESPLPLIRSLFKGAGLLRLLRLIFRRLGVRRLGSTQRVNVTGDGMNFFRFQHALPRDHPFLWYPVPNNFQIVGEVCPMNPKIITEVRAD